MVGTARLLERFGVLLIVADPYWQFPIPTWEWVEQASPRGEANAYVMGCICELPEYWRIIWLR